MIISAAYPIAQSFEWRLRYYKKWRYLIPAILIMMIIFIPWDIWFTDTGVWWFNDKYVSGIRIFLLPIEEWLFFIIVPFACVFIYEVLNYYIKKDFLRPVANYVFILLSIILATLAFLYMDRTYTLITFLSTAIILVIFVFINPRWKGRFLLMYIVNWIPFLLVNGALTGNFTAEAVVNYNQNENIGFRITTIPVEDSIYNLLMLVIIISVYEWMQKRSSQRARTTDNINPS